jgi:hypothetical protein
MNKEIHDKFASLVHNLMQGRIHNLDSNLIHAVLGIGTEASLRNLTKLVETTEKFLFRWEGSYGMITFLVKLLVEEKLYILCGRRSNCRLYC